MTTSNANVVLEIIDKVIKLTKKHRATLKNKDFYLRNLEPYQITYLCDLNGILTLDSINKLIDVSKLGKVIYLGVLYSLYNTPLFYKELKEIGFVEHFGFISYTFNLNC